MTKIKIIGEVTGIFVKDGKTFSTISFANPRFNNKITSCNYIILAGEFPFKASVIAELDILEVKP